ncbi:flagellin [Pseudalkalibacillus hwajinpoensis]|uniref:Flagellin n=1 Tax=Guptibacillus hwajinpoensis TaxID=208199 RepID=A0A4U1MIZ9_9BACL|nr:flagellin [Pseudalkalibacillus hwajinpoensis]TKD70525.1 flagellin protein FlaA [Pseudalkalibacillus hwajinpoensis]
MIINHNISAMNTYRQMGTNQAAASNSMEKLSSGLRINKAADDAAGLSISEKMRGQIRGLDQASRNAQDGISLIQTAEGALSETQSMLQRMRELSVQGANDTLTSSDREQIQQEVNQLTEEISRVADTTEFNTKKLLTGDIGSSVSKGGVVSNVQQTAETKAGSYTTNISALATVADSGDILNADESSTTAAGSFDITVNGQTSTISWEANESYKDLASRINSNVSGVKATFTDNGTGSPNNFTIETVDAGKSQSVSVQANADAAFSSTDALNTTAATDTGSDVVATATDAGGNALTVSTKGDKIILSGNGSDGLSMTAKSVDSTTVTVGGSMSFHIGANEDQTMNISINAMDTQSLGVSNIDLTSTTGAEKAITSLDNAINTVSLTRSNLGSFQNRLEHTINNLNTSSENLTAAESRIRDVDMAKEMMNMTKENIKAQAAQAMLAQANQQPQQVLQLLR